MKTFSDFVVNPRQFLASSVYPQVGISVSASETADRFYFSHLGGHPASLNIIYFNLMKPITPTEQTNDRPDDLVPKWRRINVDAMWLRRIDVNRT